VNSERKEGEIETKAISSSLIRLNRRREKRISGGGEEKRGGRKKKESNRSPDLSLDLSIVFNRCRFGGGPERKREKEREERA